MNITLSNNKNNYQRNFFVFAAVFLLMFTSCSAKSSLKSLIGVPVPTEQSVMTNNHSSLVNVSEECGVNDIRETKISHTVSLEISDLLPAIILTATFLFLFGFSPSREPSHPLYRTKKIPGTLPLFLQYQNLKLLS